MRKIVYWATAMNYSQSLFYACSLVLLAGAGAQADIYLPLHETAHATGADNSALKIRTGIGYYSRYVDRGLAIKNNYADQDIPAQILGSYQFNDKSALWGGVQYQWVSVNHFTNHANDYWDEACVLLGYSYNFTPKTSAALSYQFIHGGLPGSLNSHMNTGESTDSSAFNHDLPEEHSFLFDFHHDFGKGLENFFWDSRIQYTFCWMSGWWFTNTVGYRYEINKSVDLIVKGTWNATDGYFNHRSKNTNGTQGITAGLELPIKVTDRFTITPLLRATWLGNGGMSANKRAGSETVYRNFTLVAGATLIYTF